MSATLRLDRAGFILLIAVVTSTETFATALVQLYASSPLATLTIPFMAGLANAVIVYLSTESAPAEPPAVNPPG